MCSPSKKIGGKAIYVEKENPTVVKINKNNDLCFVGKVFFAIEEP